MQSKLLPLFISSLLVVLFSIFGLSSCREDRFTMSPDDKLRLEVDTISFDTVFTTLGSVTKKMKIYNEALKHLNVNSITLGGGNNSPFRLNVDGTPGISFTDVEVGPEDSVYLFVEVTVDPNDQSMPFVIEDSIMFESNGNVEKLRRIAFGQNAVIFNNVEVSNEVLTNDLPYVFFNVVYVPQDSFLTMNEGVQVYIHRNSRFLVEGELNINGTLENPVTFQGNRLEEYFDELSAQWTGIELLRNSTANVNYAYIRNSVYGFVMGSIFKDTISISEDITEANAPVLNLQNTIIQNCLLSGFSAFRSIIDAENCLFHTCGQNILEIGFGGQYDFRHCTFANYGSRNLDHRDPIISVSNAIQVAVSETEAEILTVETDLLLANSIVHGGLEEEIFIANQLENGAPINAVFEHCILRTELEQSDERLVNCILNPNPADTLFDNRQDWDFRLDSLSPAINAGNPNIANFPAFDIENKSRSNMPDLGCFEYN